jgi:rhamnopyranosyl-N-acetylglucosaminyl-diphospho-decaprenol beta-1,3/1,4-galactofuranosyltransferase
VQTQKIAAVTVTYNRLTRLRVTLEHTLAEELDYIVIVNNNSTDGTAVWLDSLTDCRVHVLHLPENSGGAGGFHEGFKYVNENLDVDWLVCFDDDAWPAKGAIRKFRQLKLSGKVGAVTARVNLPSGEVSGMNRPGYSPFRSFSSFLRTASRGSKGFHITDDEYKAGNMVPVDWCSFVGCFIRCSIISERLGYPQKELFLYGDDVMYTLSITEKGYLLLFVSDIVFYHDCETIDKNKKIYTPLWKAYYTYRNGLLMYRAISGVLYPLIALMKIMLWLSYLPCYVEKRRYLSLVFYAVKDGLFNDLSRSHRYILQICGHVGSNQNGKTK